jgi:hypothetical protein
MGQRTHESADADDADLFAGPGAATDEARVGGEAGAEHRRGRLGWERVRNRKDVELVGDDAASSTRPGSRRRRCRCPPGGVHQQSWVEMERASVTAGPKG